MLAKIAAEFDKGGLVMWAILSVSAMGIAIIATRVLVLRAAMNVKKDELLNAINSYILQGNLDKAIAIVSQVRTPLTNIVRAGLVAVQNGKDNEEVQTAMDAVALREIPKLERWIPILMMLSNLATLLGLLGTVTGMIGAFGAVANVAPSEKATMLAGAIAHALNATAFGLGIGIMLLFCYGWLGAFAQDAVDDIHESSVSTLNFILTNRKKMKNVVNG